MKLEVLVSTMHQKDLSLLGKMNVTSDAIVVNQCDHFNYIEEKKEGSFIRMFFLKERGVGKSRNNALMRSNADICLLADDDVVYVDNYEKIILDEFKRNPKADVIIFGVEIIDNNGKEFKMLKNNRVRFFNSLKYGAVRIAFRRDVIVKNNIFFSLLFGGGAKYGSGEDSIFLTDCLKKGLKIYTSSKKISDVYNYESTWFKGYNQKFFIDKGALFGAVSSQFANLLIFQFALRRYSLYKNEMKFWDAYSYMIRGLSEYRRRI